MSVKPKLKQSLRYLIGLKTSRHFFNQSEFEVKPKPMVSRSHTFSRPFSQLHRSIASFDWFNAAFVWSFMIGHEE